MDFPGNLKYSKDHEWMDGTSGTVTVGVTAYAVDQLGDIVHVDLPEVGETFDAGAAFGTIESTKTVSDLYMPAAGKVTEVNKNIKANPEAIQEAPHGDGWLVKLEITGDAIELLDADAYQKFISEQED